MKAVFTRAGSSSEGAGRGAQQRPLHPEALPVPPCASLLPSLLKLKPVCSYLPISPAPLRSGVRLEHPRAATGTNLVPAETSKTAKSRMGFPVVAPQPSSPSRPSNSRSPTGWAPTAEGPYSGLSPPRVEWSLAFSKLTLFSHSVLCLFPSKVDSLEPPPTAHPTLFLLAAHHQKLTHLRLPWAGASWIPFRISCGCGLRDLSPHFI